MATDVQVPALGESITEGTLAEWLNIDERTVRRAIQELEQTSVMVVQRVHRRVHHYLVPYFWVLADKLSGKHAVLRRLTGQKCIPRWTKMRLSRRTKMHLQPP